MVVFVSGGGLLLLFFADFQVAGTSGPSALERARWVVNHGDHVHYAVHVATGRILSLCPCTRRAAATQYYRAHFHALTPHQRALLDSSNPRTPGQWLGYFVAPVQVGVEWIGDGVAWLRGDRPVSSVEVEIRGFAFEPAELTVNRGTTVRWRNVDGVAHTVTSDGSHAFDSGWLEPEKAFAYTFTERGTYAYFGSVDYDDPTQHELTGVIVVR